MEYRTYYGLTWDWSKWELSPHTSLELCTRHYNIFIMIWHKTHYTLIIGYRNRSQPPKLYCAIWNIGLSFSYWCIESLYKYIVVYTMETMWNTRKLLKIERLLQTWVTIPNYLHLLLHINSFKKYFYFDFIPTISNNISSRSTTIIIPVMFAGAVMYIGILVFRHTTTRQFDRLQTKIIGP